MKLTPVDSSHVEAVGFLPDEGVMLVRYKGGALSARTGVSVDRYMALLESASKGSFLAAMTEQSVAITRDQTPAAKPIAPPNGPPVAPMTLDDMMKTKAASDSRCDFAVVPHSK